MQFIKSSLWVIFFFCIVSLLFTIISNESVMSVDINHFGKVERKSVEESRPTFSKSKGVNEQINDSLDRLGQKLRDQYDVVSSRVAVAPSLVPPEHEMEGVGQEESQKSEGDEERSLSSDKKVRELQKLELIN